jgi:hypothetical protein
MKQIPMLGLGRKSKGVREKTKHEKARIGNHAQIQSHQRNIHPVEIIGDISKCIFGQFVTGKSILKMSN